MYKRQPPGYTSGSRTRGAAREGPARRTPTRKETTTRKDAREKKTVTPEASSAALLVRETRAFVAEDAVRALRDGRDGATRLGTALLRAWDPRRPSGGLLGMMSLPTSYPSCT